MNKKSIYTYIAASLALLVPPPGRFVYGFVLVIELNFLMFSGTCLSAYIKRFSLEKFETPFVLIILVTCTIFFKQIFILLQTEIALTLGFDFYLPTVSSFLIGYIYNSKEGTVGERLKTNMLSSLLFSVFALGFFLFRDIAGYGTFTFIGHNHQVYEKVLFDANHISIFSFFATIPGALILCAIILAFYIGVNRKLRIVQRAVDPNSHAAKEGENQ